MISNTRDEFGVVWLVFIFLQCLSFCVVLFWFRFLVLSFLRVIFHLLHILVTGTAIPSQSTRECFIKLFRFYFLVLAVYLHVLFFFSFVNNIITMISLRCRTNFSILFFHSVKHFGIAINLLFINNIKSISRDGCT